MSRAALYRTYDHLKAEFERRMAQLHADGQLPDPRAAQILRLKVDNACGVPELCTRPLNCSDPVLTF